MEFEDSPGRWMMLGSRDGPLRHYVEGTAGFGSGQSAPKLHLGCGRDRLDDWVNIDGPASRSDLEWDLTQPQPLPMGDASASAVYCGRGLARLEPAQAVTLLAECRRVLKPGGLLRLNAQGLRLPSKEKELARVLRGAGLSGLKLGDPNAADLVPLGAGAAKLGVILEATPLAA